MNKLTSASLFFLAAGILTSVTILSAYQILFAIPLCYYTYVAIQRKNIKLPKSAWFLLAFTVVALISLILNYDLIPKPTKNFGRLKYFLFGIGGIFVFRVWIKETTDQVKKILSNTFFLSIVIAGGFAINDYLHSEIGRANGLTDTMRYGYGSAMLLLTLLSAVLNRDKIKGWFDWRFALIAIVVGFGGMYLTYTRGALLGFLCGIPFVLYFFRPKVGIFFGLGAALIGLTLGYFYLYGNVQLNSGSRFLMSKNNSGDVIRRSQWQAAVIAIKEKPVFGYGLSNFHSQLKRIKQQYDLDRKDYDDAHSHNLFLEVTSGTGFIGLFFFVAWLVMWAIESFKASGLVRSLVVPFGVAFVVSSQFEVTLDANNASMIFFLYAMSSASKKYVE